MDLEDRVMRAVPAQSADAFALMIARLRWIADRMTAVDHPERVALLVGDGTYRLAARLNSRGGIAEYLIQSPGQPEAA